MRKILATVGAFALAVILASVSIRSSGVERLKSDDVRDLQGGQCYLNRAINVDKVKYGAYYYTYSKPYMVSCIRATTSSFFGWYQSGETITQFIYSSGTEVCDDGTGHPLLVTAVSGYLGSFNITRIYGSIGGTPTDICT